MASTYTSRLKLERQASGENSGNWGNLVNYVLNRIDSTVRGYVAVGVAGSANVTLVSNTSTSNTDDSSTDDQVHNKVIEFTGVLTGSIHVFTDAVEGDYTLFNNTTGSYSLTFANTGHAANGVVLTQGTKSMVYTDGSTIYDVMADLGDIAMTSVTSTGNVSATNFNATANVISIAGAAPSITSSTANSDILLSPTGVASRVTFNGGGKIQQVAEKVTTEATAATGTVNYDVITQAVWNFTTNASANWTLNVRGDGSNSLDSIMDTGESITIAHIVSQGATAYYNSAFEIDGSAVTPEWQGGSAPTAGNASSLDTYSYTIIKTASATFTVLAAQTQFA
jgi:hypothetical protein